MCFFVVELGQKWLKVSEIRCRQAQKRKRTAAAAKIKLRIGHHCRDRARSVALARHNCIQKVSAHARDEDRVVSVVEERGVGHVIEERDDVGRGLVTAGDGHIDCVNTRPAKNAIFGSINQR